MEQFAMSTIPSTASLKLVDDADSDAMAFERRVANRFVITGQVTAVRKPPHTDEPINRICSFELLNISDTGLGVISKEPIELQSRITIFFPPHGPERGFDLYGQAVRCLAVKEGYEIGIRIEKNQMAA